MDIIISTDQIYFVANIATIVGVVYSICQSTSAKKQVQAVELKVQSLSTQISQLSSNVITNVNVGADKANEAELKLKQDVETLQTTIASHSQGTFNAMQELFKVFEGQKDMNVIFRKRCNNNGDWINWILKNAIFKEERTTVPPSPQ